MNKTLLIILILFSYGFLPQMDEVGRKISWAAEKKIFAVYLESLSGNYDDDLAITRTIFDQLESESSIQFVDESNEALADIVFQVVESGESFSNDHEAAKTKLTYEDGAIKKANIYINANYEISLDENNFKYIGNIIAHELGHALGLAHSANPKSTMYPYLNYGQSTFSEDDLSFVRSSFEQIDTKFNGKVSGSVKSSTDGVGVFGVTVELISINKPDNIITTFTEYDGSFSLEHLNTDEQYLLRISPSLYGKEFPVYLSFARYDLCPSNQVFRPFFVKSNCDKSGKENPFLLDFRDGNEVELDNIGIQCGSESGNNYLDSLANKSIYELKNVDKNLSSVGFWAEELNYPNSWETPLVIKVPISEIKNSIGEFFTVELGVISQGIGSSSILNLVSYTDQDLSLFYKKVNNSIDDLGNIGVSEEGVIKSDGSMTINLNDFNQDYLYIQGQIISLNDYVDQSINFSREQVFSIVNDFGEVSTAMIYLKVLEHDGALHNYRGSLACSQGVQSFNFPDLKSNNLDTESPELNLSDGGGLFNCSASASSGLRGSVVGGLFSTFLGYFIFFGIFILCRSFKIKFWK